MQQSVVHLGIVAALGICKGVVNNSSMHCLKTNSAVAYSHTADNMNSCVCCYTLAKQVAHASK